MKHETRIVFTRAFDFGYDCKHTHFNVDAVQGDKAARVRGMCNRYNTDKGIIYACSLFGIGEFDTPNLTEAEQWFLNNAKITFTGKVLNSQTDEG